MNEQQRHFASALLQEVTQQPARPFSTTDFGRIRNPECVSVVVPKDQGEAYLLKLREKLQPGLVAFIGTIQSHGKENPPNTEELVIGPGTEQVDILRLAKTDAVNYDLTNEQIIQKVRELDQRYGIDILHACTDTVQFDLENDPPDFEELAKELYAFCPDMVDQGAGSVEDLAEGIEAGGRVYMWWD